MVDRVDRPQRPGMQQPVPPIANEIGERDAEQQHQDRRPGIIAFGRVQREAAVHDQEIDPGDHQGADRHHQDQVHEIVDQVQPRFAPGPLDPVRGRPALDH